MKLPLLLNLCDKLAVATKANSDNTAVHWSPFAPNCTWVTASDSSQLCPKRRTTLPGRKLLGPSVALLVSAVLHHKGHLRTHLRTHSGEK